MKLNDAKDKVDDHRPDHGRRADHRRERPVRGSRDIPADHLEQLKARLPFARRQAARSAAHPCLARHGRRRAARSRLSLWQRAHVGAPRISDVARVQLAVAADDTARRPCSARSRSKATCRSTEDVIRRELAFNEGDLYQLSRITESQRRLYGLELFQFANVTPRLPEDRAPQVPIDVTVAEGKHRRLQLGAGYGSEERARGRINWRHVNFGGGARTGEIEAKGVLARAGRSRQLYRAVSLSARAVASADGVVLVGERARLRIPQQRRPRRRRQGFQPRRRWRRSAACAIRSARRSFANTRTMRLPSPRSEIRRFGMS